jgi:hypothetical protein
MQVYFQQYKKRAKAKGATTIFFPLFFKSSFFFGREPPPKDNTLDSLVGKMLFVPLQALAKGKDFHDQGPDCQVLANTIIFWLCDVTSSQLRSGDVA